MSEIMDVARTAASRAGRLLREHFGGVREIGYKGRIDLVTEMDRRSEQEITALISRAYPDHGIIAEEGTEHAVRSEYRWIVDPLDGTTNYAHGFPIYAVSIGLERSGEVVLGVVYDVMRDEMFTAETGSGAFLNGRPIRVSATADLPQSLLATGFPYDRTAHNENNLDYFSAMILQAQEVRRCGSAAIDLCSVAAGRIDGYWELKLKPWDVAAGSVIVREAGGTVSGISGERYDIRGSAIVADNTVIHGQLIETLQRAGRK